MSVFLENETLHVEISETGAEITSVSRVGKEQCEYIWGGDPKYWSERSPLLFPICGRLPGGRFGHYTWQGVEYGMNIHGFLRAQRAGAVSAEPDRAVFEFSDTNETRAQWPFSFSLRVEYRLVGDTIETTISVLNRCESGPMPFCFGFHPGFNVPLGGGDSSFEDWEIAFDSPCWPDRVEFSEDVLPTGRFLPYELTPRFTLPLAHSLFDDDAIFLTRCARGLSLRSPKSPRFVHFSYPDFPVLGFWHANRTDAPYVCIEPWTGLPSRAGEPEDLATKGGCFRPLPGQSVALRAAIQFG